MKVGDSVKCIKTKRIGIIINESFSYSSWGEKHHKIKWSCGTLEIYAESWVKKTMEKGSKVKEINSGKTGVSHGPTTVFGVEWILVEYENGGKAVVLEQCLEVIDESR